MPDIPINDRPYQLFISYAHEDSDFVLHLVSWLSNNAGLKVWYDERRLHAGAMVAAELPYAIQSASGALFVLSKASHKSGWVKEEYGAALEQRAAHSEYRILVIRIDETEPPAFLRTTKWIDAPNRTLNPTLGLRIVQGLYSDSAGALRKDRDIYISRSWRSAEAEPADSICRTLADRGYRLIGDSTDQKVFDTAKRIPSIIASCGAVVAIAPNRAGCTSPFIEEEITIALNLGVPCLAILSEGVALTQSLNERLPPGHRMTAGDPHTVEMQSISDAVHELFRPAPRPHYVFYAASLLKSPETNEYVREVIDAVSGIDCVLGEKLTGQHAQNEIIRSIRNALFVIADVSEQGGVNTLIEAGIALGAGTRLHLVVVGEPRPPRFMFRDIEINFYRDELDLIGKIHSIARPYRRRILNRELQNSW